MLARAHTCMNMLTHLSYKHTQTLRGEMKTPETLHIPASGKIIKEPEEALN